MKLNGLGLVTNRACFNISSDCTNKNRLNRNHQDLNLLGVQMSTSKKLAMHFKVVSFFNLESQEVSNMFDFL